MDVNSISKITLRSSDFARTERFYHELFGWKFHQYSPTYLGFEPPSGIGGGFQRRDAFSQGDSYLLYILVEEFESYLRRIPELGGQCAAEVEVVSERSQYIRVYDPDGNRLALWKDAPVSDSPTGQNSEYRGGAAIHGSESLTRSLPRAGPYFFRTSSVLLSPAKAGSLDLN